MTNRTPPDWACYGHGYGNGYGNGYGSGYGSGYGDGPDGGYGNGSPEPIVTTPRTYLSL